MKIARALLYAVGILSFAAILCTFILEEDAWLKQKLQTTIVSSLEQSWNCRVTAQVERIRLLSGSVELRNLTVQPTESAHWQWQSEQVIIDFSWITLLLKKRIVAFLTLNNLALTSTVTDGELAILPHLQQLVKPAATTVPFDAQQITIQQNTINIHTTDRSMTIHSNLQLTASSDGYRIKGNFEQGAVMLKSQPVVSNITGILEGVLGFNNAITVHGSCAYAHQPSNDQHGKFSANLDTAGCLFSFDSDHHTFHGMATVDYHKDQVSAQCTIPAAHIASIMNSSLPVQGAIQITLAGPLKTFPHESTMSIHTEKLSYQNIKLPELRAQLVYKQALLQGTINIFLPGAAHICGTCRIDPESSRATCTLRPTTIVRLPEQWTIPSQGTTCVLTLQPDGILSSTYTIRFENSDTKQRKIVKGTLQWNAEQIRAQGAGERFAYDFLAAAKPVWHLEYCDCHLNNELVIALKAESPELFAGVVGYPLVRWLMSAVGWHVPGEGIVHVRGNISQQDGYLTFGMKNGNIRLPHTYNLIQDIQATLQCDFTHRSWALKDILIKLHKGSLSSSRITGQLDEKYQLSYVHAPLILDHCFLSRKKDLFALFSGALTFQYHKDQASTLQGFIVLDRAHIRSNIFSAEFQRHLFGTTASPFNFSGSNDINFNVHILTKSPLRVKTSFLEAAAHIKGLLTGSMSSPALTGTVTIDHGSFLFPYKPLFIKRGVISFLPQQLDDPIVDIVAEANIKKYSLRMTVNGSIKSPHISFSANPSLAEEQAIGLLLGGSEDSSLYLAMPSSIMNSIENLLFGPSSTTSQFQRTLQNLFAPLKNLRITPSLSDQTGRGGLRGKLTLEVNDRLRALIEQNFSLPEDTLIEVEYDLSDEARIRATKDQRGDLGGELEARWKF